MVLLSLLAYALRVFGYSCLQPHTVWALLALEPLHGITYALSWTAAVDKVGAGWCASRCREQRLFTPVAVNRSRRRCPPRGRPQACSS